MDNPPPPQDQLLSSNPNAAFPRPPPALATLDLPPLAAASAHHHHPHHHRGAAGPAPRHAPLCSSPSDHPHYDPQPHLYMHQPQFLLDQIHHQPQLPCNPPPPPPDCHEWVIPATPSSASSSSSSSSNIFSLHSPSPGVLNTVPLMNYMDHTAAPLLYSNYDDTRHHHQQLQQLLQLQQNNTANAATPPPPPPPSHHFFEPAARYPPPPPHHAQLDVAAVNSNINNPNALLLDTLNPIDPFLHDPFHAVSRVHNTSSSSSSTSLADTSCNDRAGMALQLYNQSSRTIWSERQRQQQQLMLRFTGGGGGVHSRNDAQVAQPEIMSSTSTSTTSNTGVVSVSTSTAYGSRTHEQVEGACTPRPRWCPTQEQIQILESIFNAGTTTPSREMIVDIAGQLRRFGNIAEANVFYWFQNRKARAKRKLHQQPPPPQAAPPSTTSSSSSSNNTNNNINTTTTTTTTTTSMSTQLRRL